MKFADSSLFTLYFSQVMLSSDILAVDAIIFLLSLLVCTHIVLKTREEGVTCCIAIFSIALISEQLSITLGDTHCHHDSDVFNFSKCSSGNSVIFYIPWMYSCYFIGKEVAFSSVQARSAFIGLLHPLFCIMYELTGYLANL